jgi:hypothetical protein
MDTNIVFAFIILILGSALCVWYGNKTMEGFEGELGSMCGVDLPTCKFGTRCINGYCKTENSPTLPAYSELKVEPSDLQDYGSFLHTE